MPTEHIIGTVNDLQPGEMKSVEIDDLTLLLVRTDAGYKAFVGECPHHGAPLGDGVLQDGCVWCPWHQAVFDADTGRALEPPAWDDLPSFEVRQDGDDLVVTLPESPPSAKTPAMAEPSDAADTRTFVIVGAGAAGAAAAETLRREGFRGRIRMITREPHRPYDRTDLSKRYMGAPDAKAPYYRNESFYDDHGIEILYETVVEHVDPQARRLRCQDGQELSYDALLLATGGLPRHLNIDGEQLGGVFTLRSFEDAKAISQAAGKAKRAVVVGASFIAMEVCASLRKRDIDVTVIAPESTPFEKVFGQKIGQMYRKVHEDKGATFLLGHTVKRFAGDDGWVTAAVMDDDTKVEADLVVIGVGVVPATDFLDNFDLAEDGAVKVDLHLRAAEGVYAAGDIARVPDPHRDGFVRIEHWRVAQQQGVVAARNMLGAEVAWTDAPFFWTNQHMVITDYAGHAERWDHIVFDGDPAERDFLAMFVRNNRVEAVVGCGRERGMNKVMPLLAGPECVTEKQVRAVID